MMEGWMDGRMDAWMMEGWTDERSGRMDGVDGRTDGFIGACA